MKFLIILGALVCLSACADHKTKIPNELYGRWQMLDDNSGQKGFVLGANGRAEFIEIEMQDIGGDEKGALPPTGKWEISSKMMK